jgi:hypothetical protein
MRTIAKLKLPGFALVEANSTGLPRKVKRSNLPVTGSLMMVLTHEQLSCGVIEIIRHHAYVQRATPSAAPPSNWGYFDLRAGRKPLEDL